MAASNIKVLDFGIAKVANVPVSLTQSTTILGTPTYMSPEQMRPARDIDGRSDIWSLGAVLPARLVEGHVAFPAPTFAGPRDDGRDRAASAARCRTGASACHRALSPASVVEDRYRDLAEPRLRDRSPSQLPRRPRRRVSRGPIAPSVRRRVRCHWRPLCASRRKRGLFAPLLIGSVVVAAAAATIVVLTHQPEQPRVPIDRGQHATEGRCSCPRRRTMSPRRSMPHRRSRRCSNVYEDRCCAIDGRRSAAREDRCRTSSEGRRAREDRCRASLKAKVDPKPTKLTGRQADRQAGREAGDRGAEGALRSLQRPSPGC